MRKISILALALCLSFVLNTIVLAAENVVVIPLNTNKVVSQLQPIAQGTFSSGCEDFFSYGVANCTVNGTGDFTITLTESFTGYANVIATSYNTSPQAEIATAGSVNTGNTITIQIADGSGTAIGSDFNFVVYANVQATVSASAKSNDITKKRE